MLLNQAIASQQNLYSEIQVQIEQLQERQREIQAYLQRLGGVESKMESAAQLLQEAIAEIRNVCPAELPAYEQLINGLFGSQAIAQLAASTPEPEPLPTKLTEPTAPTAPTEPSTTIEVVAAEIATVEAVATVVTVATPIETKEETGESHAESVSPPDFSTLSYKNLQQLAKRWGVNPKGLKRPELETLLSQTHAENLTRIVTAA